MQNNQWAEALSSATQLLVQQPTNPKLQAYAGLCHMQARRFQEASEFLKRATQLDPFYWEAASKLAQCYYQLHAYRQGLDLCEHFIKVQPNDPTLQFMLKYFSEMHISRVEGWERTAHLAHEVTLTGG